MTLTAVKSLSTQNESLASLCVTGVEVDLPVSSNLAFLLLESFGQETIESSLFLRRSKKSPIIFWDWHFSQR